MINLCEDRYHFLAAYTAALAAGHPVLLPPSRAPEVIAEIERENPGSYRCDDALVARLIHSVESAAKRTDPAAPGAAGSHPRTRASSEPASRSHTLIPMDRVVMIGMTSGSTGQPRSYPKSWGSLSGTVACNVQAIRRALAPRGCGMPASARSGAHNDAQGGVRNGALQATVCWLLATVPPQHMYGMELSILLPLIGGMAVHAGRPLFPADIARQMEELPRPRVLVSTPVHLRAMLESSQSFPAVDLVVSATAPLDRTLAVAVEKRLGGALLEMFGSTETCVFASRRTAREDAWRAYEGVRLYPAAAGTKVDAPWFPEPVMLQDFVELQDDETFLVVGRNTDMIEIAGKRASLRELTARLLAIEGVRDAVVLQPEAPASGAIRRVAALVEAPGLTPRKILDRLARTVDAAFLPRPLLIVDRLPRNELGKLPRERILAVLDRHRHRS